MKHLFALLALACLLGACVSLSAPGEKGAAVSSPETENTAGAAGRLPPGDGLDSPRFRDLPKEAKDYLRLLAGAFRNKDKEFLISQGEIQYENEHRFRLEEEAYLAMLYRVGPYSEEDQWKPSTLPLLEYTEIEEIEYTGWEEKGPMLEISGYLYPRNGNPVPCGITIVWRLVEPKILGAMPD